MHSTSRASYYAIKNEFVMIIRDQLFRAKWIDYASIISSFLSIICYFVISEKLFLHKYPLHNSFFPPVGLLENSAI